MIKRAGKQVRAYELGRDDAAMADWFREGRILRREDGSYEVFSLETVGKTGELAQPGDFIKMDAKGNIYPNRADYFRANHCAVGEYLYEQQPTPLEAWTITEPPCEQIRFLMAAGRLRYDPTAEYPFTAALWGTEESAKADAVIVFFTTHRNEAGEILDVDFNFVAREIFEQDYLVL